MLLGVVHVTDLHIKHEGVNWVRFFFVKRLRDSDHGLELSMQNLSAAQNLVADNLINIFISGPCLSRHYHGQTIYHIKKFISMNELFAV